MDMSDSRYEHRDGRDDTEDSPVREDNEYDGAVDVEKSTKHHNKDRKRSGSVREDKEHRSGKEREEKAARDSEKDRVSGRDRKKDDRDERDRERSKDSNKLRDRDYDRDKHREKDRKDRGKEKDREEKDSERGRDKEKGKEKSRDKDRERNKVKDKERETEREKHKGREKEKESYRDGEKEKGKEKIREKDREIDQDKERSRASASNHAEDGLNHEGSTQPSAAEVEERILKMRESRTDKQPEGASEILSWVHRSRKLEEKKIAEKEKAKQLSKLFEEQDNVIHEESEDVENSLQTSYNLAGVKVLHGLDRVIEGGAVVLTLKDQNILAEGDINQDIDMLENVEIGEQKRRDDAYKAAKKKTGIYDDKFNDDSFSEKILPQYDEPTADEGFTLDERGRISGEAEKKLEELRRRIQGVYSKSHFEDLNSYGKTTSDYYTQEEMLQFKKPKKKKSLRKKEKLDIEALEAEAVSSGLGAGDLGSRNDRSRQAIKEEKEKLEAEMRNNAYKSALAKADEASKLLRLEQMHTINMEEDETPVFAAADDDDLSKSLERARRLALRKQEEEAASGPQAVALLATSNPSRQMAEEQASVAGEGQENKVVFTEMEEFVWGLQIDEEAHKPKSEDVFMQEDEDTNTVDEVKTEDGGGWTEVTEAENGEPQDNDEEVIVPDETIHEATLGKGLSGALRLLQDRGTLKETIEWGGRNMDKKKSKLVGILEDGEQKEVKKEIRIERTDEFGRILTPKEAFRLISHKFHGKGPGKMKLEKRQKQFQEELKMKQMKSTDTPSLSVERMRETQARLKTPYLVLSGHVKPGQTSDPKSGFATVEKDFSGGLTPMLGDQKVEHFLGIKRKADPSSSSSSKKHKP